MMAGIMEEYLYEKIARRIWGAMDPDGIPWHSVAETGRKARMRKAAKEVLVFMGVENVGKCTLSDFQVQFEKRAQRICVH